jgi:hypothetical protein
MSERRTTARLFVTELPVGGECYAETPDGRVRVEIEVCRDGRWRHPVHGEIAVTPALREALARNFAADVRRGPLPVDYDHRAGPAAGWFTGLRCAGQSLLAEVELTERAAARIRRGEYRFFSPEWTLDWVDPESGGRHGPTLLGGALTNRPFFRGLAAIRCRETGPDGHEEEAMAERVEAAETQRLRERVAALEGVEAELSTLRAAEERRVLEEAVAALRFGEGRALAPRSRAALAAALGGVAPGQREPVLAALREAQVVVLGEQGFAEDEPAGAVLTAGEEAALAQLAGRHGLRVEELRASYVAARGRRGGGGQAGTGSGN